MRISLKWLKELLDLPAEMTAQDVAERLTMVGLEAESVEDLSVACRALVVGTIVSRDKHPNADTLSVCAVDVGLEAPLKIVCGAPNCDVGKQTAVATVGVTLPGGLLIAPRDLRGVQSQGMLCSSKELGLPGGSHDGILILEGTHVPGSPLASALGLEDHVLTLAITPNRPDALCHVGVARDLAAALSMPSSSPPGQAGPTLTPHAFHVKIEERDPNTRRAAPGIPAFRVKPPAATCAERGGPVDDAVHVRVEDPLRCARYSLRVIEGITVGPAPQWLVRRLETCGMRSVNNVVDATNLVMMERGHPLHAFDADKVGLERGRPTVVVRCARAGEKITTLDGVERALQPDDLCICDPDKPLALAGIMGGAAAEVHAGTTRVLLESAYFDPAGIRRSSKRHGLHTEASHRFERGCDPNRTLEEALNRTAQLLADLAGGAVRRGIHSTHPRPIEPVEVSVRPARVASLLGLPPKMADEAMVARALTALGLEVAGRDATALRFRVPTFRPDLTLEVDLIEEVGRLMGLDRIPELLPKGSGKLMQARSPDGLLLAQEQARTALLAAGFDEAVNMGFVAPKEAAPFEGEGAAAQRLILRNPLSEDLSVMRQSLLPGLMRNVLHNLRHGEREVRLFECGTVFLGTRPQGVDPRPQSDDGPPGGDAYALERTFAAWAMLGSQMPLGHQPRTAAALDFYDAKGVVEELLNAVGLKTSLWDGQVHWAPVNSAVVPHLHPGMAASVMYQGVPLGSFGLLHPKLAKRFEIRGEAWLGEMDLTVLAQHGHATTQHAQVNRLPAVKRDLSALLDESITVGQLVASVKGTAPAQDGLLENVELFDLYRDDKLPPGKKSVGLSLVFRSPEKTLTDDAVNTMHLSVMTAVERDLKAEVRKA